MICKDCPSMKTNWVTNKPDEAYCIGVKHPFKIENIYGECTEYLNDNVSVWRNLDLINDTYSVPKLVVLVGLPGSGKSTYAREFIKNNNKAIWLSSDDIRAKLWGDASCQNDPAKVFSFMQEQTILFLDKGFDVVYDATSIDRKSRASILEKVPKYVKKECVIIWAPVDICIERDNARTRTVGEAVINKMLRRFEAPFYDEGFDNIKVHISDVHYNKDTYYTNLIAALNIPHDNLHHSANVKEHCYNCGALLFDKVCDPIIVKAGYLHDIGKPYTKTFKNRRGEDCESAHYYDHQAVGAYLSYGIRGHSITLAWLISTHMAPFINQKYYNSLPTCYRQWIDCLHQADRSAH